MREVETGVAKRDELRHGSTVIDPSKLDGTFTATNPAFGRVFLGRGL
jgi:hypothetical protein